MNALSGGVTKGKTMKTINMFGIAAMAMLAVGVTAQAKEIIHDAEY